jgi:hypothetical protein
LRNSDFDLIPLASFSQERRGKIQIIRLLSPSLLGEGFRERQKLGREI